jgi:hypothetical protein
MLTVRALIRGKLPGLCFVVLAAIDGSINQGFLIAITYFYPYRNKGKKERSSVAS